MVRTDEVGFSCFEGADGRNLCVCVLITADEST